jgi:acetolactate synthase regulatory subunit
MKTKYRIELNDAQRQHLEKQTSSGMASARQIKRAQILLKSDQQGNWTDDQISKAFDVSAVTIAQVRKTAVEQGMDETLQRKKPDREYDHVRRG